jgi:malate dehydrogenase (oxaloacetate-decarboxylating)(NADP+)
VPDAVLRAYGLTSLRFGREYLIPKPFDYRVLLRVPPAVARAAMESGVARRPIDDFAAYQRRLETLISRRLELMRGVIDRAKRSPRRVVFPEGEHEQILRAAKILVDEGIAHPILLARREVIADRLRDLDLPEERVTIIHNESSERFEAYARRLHELRRRDGVTLTDARKRLRLRNYFGMMMVEMGDADGLISGLTQHYPETIRPALEIVGTRTGVERVSGTYVLILQDRVFFFADTTVNIEPTPEDLAEIAQLTVGFVRRFGIVPRVAMLSFSNFGSNKHPSARKVRRAVEIVSAREPDLEIDGEMQADTAVEQILLDNYPWSQLKQPANVLIFPELQSANIAYKLMWRLAGAEAIGPILLGMAKPVHVLQSGLEVSDIVNMAALCVVDAQELEEN